MVARSRVESGGMTWGNPEATMDTLAETSASATSSGITTLENKILSQSPAHAGIFEPVTAWHWPMMRPRSTARLVFLFTQIAEKTVPDVFKRQQPPADGVHIRCGLAVPLIRPSAVIQVFIRSESVPHFMSHHQCGQSIGIQ